MNEEGIKVSARKILVLTCFFNKNVLEMFSSFYLLANIACSYLFGQAILFQICFLQKYFYLLVYVIFGNWIN